MRREGGGSRKYKRLRSRHEGEPSVVGVPAVSLLKPVSPFSAQNLRADMAGQSSAGLEPVTKPLFLLKRQELARKIAQACGPVLKFLLNARLNI